MNERIISAIANINIFQMCSGLRMFHLFLLLHILGLD